MTYDDLPTFGALFTDQPWRDLAACAGSSPDLFFGDVGHHIDAAKAVCRTCPVIQDCKDFALDNDERTGVWGGLSARERRKLKRKPERERPINHGTNGGYQAHARRSDPACLECLDAHFAAKAEWMAGRVAS